MLHVIFVLHRLKKKNGKKTTIESDLLLALVFCEAFHVISCPFHAISCKSMKKNTDCWTFHIRLNWHYCWACSDESKTKTDDNRFTYFLEASKNIWKWFDSLKKKGKILSLTLSVKCSIGFCLLIKLPNEIFLRWVISLSANMSS